MEIKKPKSLEEFLEIFDKYEYNKNDCYYRVQADSKWEIVPSLARNKNIFNSFLKVEKKLIEKFNNKIVEYELNYLIPILKGSIDESWQILMIAQHYGLPSRLMDFTNNKYVALEFAFNEFEYLKKDSALFIYCNADNNQRNEVAFFEKPLDTSLQETFFLNAEITLKSNGNDFRLSERRKFTQGSKFLFRGNTNLFCCFSLDDTHSQNLIKIELSCKIKPEIIKHFIIQKKIFIDPYRGKNAIDYLCKILKTEFLKLNDNNIAEFLKT